MNLRNKKKLKIPELITILSLSIGLWLFFYNRIVEVGSNDIYTDIVLSLALSHAFIFYNVCFTLVLLYNKTQQRFLNRRMFLISKKINSYLTNLWLPIIVFCLVNFLIFHLNFGINFEYKLAVNSLLSFFLTVVFFVFLYQISICKLINKNCYDFIVWGGLIMFSYYIYLPILVIISSDVEVVFDKKFYKNERVYFTINSRGYMFLPNIKSIMINGTDSLNPYNLNHEINQNKLHEQNNFIEVIYEPQVFKIEKEKIFLVPFKK